MGASVNEGAVATVLNKRVNDGNGNVNIRSWLRLFLFLFFFLFLFVGCSFVQQNWDSHFFRWWLCNHRSCYPWSGLLSFNGWLCNLLFHFLLFIVLFLLFFLISHYILATFSFCGCLRLAMLSPMNTDMIHTPVGIGITGGGVNWKGCGRFILFMRCKTCYCYKGAYNLCAYLSIELWTRSHCIHNIGENHYIGTGVHVLQIRICWIVQPTQN